MLRCDLVFVMIPTAIVQNRPHPNGEWSAGVGGPVWRVSLPWSTDRARGRYLPPCPGSPCLRLFDHLSVFTDARF